MHPQIYPRTTKEKGLAKGSLLRTNNSRKDSVPARLNRVDNVHTNKASRTVVVRRSVAKDLFPHVSRRKSLQKKKYKIKFAQPLLS